jgi:hypothetical protein
MPAMEHSNFRQGLTFGFGLAVSISVVVVVWIGVLVLITVLESRSEAEQEVDRPLDVEIEEHHVVSGPTELTISGVVFNNTDVNWKRIIVVAEVSAQGLTVGCDTWVYGVQPRARHGFLIRCHDAKVSGEKTYTIAVKHGYRYVPDA